MAAADTTLDPRDPPEPGWTREDFERLTEAEAAAVLLRRLQRLLRSGISDPVEALRLASRLELPVG